MQQCCLIDVLFHVRRLFCAWIGYYMLIAYNEIY
jgi:hypothetical protein